MRLRTVVLTCSFFYISTALTAQNVENVKIQIDGRKVIAHFSLTSPNSEGLFATSLYSSYDNYNQPLVEVTGDVGIEISPGEGKTIVWDAGKELGEFNDKIAIEIRARFYVPFVKLLSPVEGSVFKRGKEGSIEWSGGSASTDLRIELFKDGQRLKSVATTPNTGTYRWNVPANLKPASGYYLKLSDSRNPEDAVQTSVFSIGRKFPTGLKVGALVLVGAVVYFLIPEKEEPDIPDPVGLPTN